MGASRQAARPPMCVSSAALLALAVLFSSRAAAQDAGQTGPGQGPGGGNGTPGQLRLGLMMPFPEGDSAVPPRVADEWMTAAKLTLNILASEYTEWFSVVYFVMRTNCSQESAAQAAQTLVADDVHAVVGPACSESVVGADPVMRANNLTYISFAATADVFSTAKYPTFFRTAFPDSYQAQAIAAVAKEYHLTSLYILYSNETYGRGLNAALQQALSSPDSPGVSFIDLAVPHPPPVAPEDWAALLEPLQAPNATTGVVLATTPAAAQAILRAAMTLGKVAFPWWYLGSDGTVTFDLVGAGQDLGPLASAIQGEIGVGPYDGVDDSGVPEPGFVAMYNYWRLETYSQLPGLLTLPSKPRLKRPRAYVVNLIDAIWALHEAARVLISNGYALTRPSVASCLRGEPPCTGAAGVSFAGASGWVQFNGSTGDRLARPPGGPAPAQYKVQNLVDLSWKYLATWQDGDGQNLTGGNALGVTRPGPIPDGAPVLGNVSEAGEYVPQSDLLEPGNAQVDILDPSTPQQPESIQSNASTSTAATTTTSSSSSSVSANSGLSPSTLAAIILLSLLLTLVAMGAIISWIRRTRHERQHHQFIRMA